MKLSIYDHVNTRKCRTNSIDIHEDESAEALPRVLLFTRHSGTTRNVFIVISNLAASLANRESEQCSCDEVVTDECLGNLCDVVLVYK